MSLRRKVADCEIKCVTLLSVGVLLNPPRDCTAGKASSDGFTRISEYAGKSQHEGRPEQREAIREHVPLWCLLYRHQRSGVLSKIGEKWREAPTQA